MICDKLVIVIITVIRQVNSHERNYVCLYPDLMYIIVHFQKKPNLGNSKNPGFDRKRFEETISFVENGKILHFIVFISEVIFICSLRSFTLWYSIEEIQHKK